MRAGRVDNPAARSVRAVRAKELAVADESLCRRCARCCYEKLLIGDEVVLTRVPCRFLDLETRLCTVYAHRHEENIRCLTVEEGIAARAFPSDCPYVQDCAAYRPPLDPESDPRARRLSAPYVEELCHD